MYSETTEMRVLLWRAVVSSSSNAMIIIRGNFGQDLIVQDIIMVKALHQHHTIVITLCDHLMRHCVKVVVRSYQSIGG